MKKRLTILKSIFGNSFIKILSLIIFVCYSQVIAQVSFQENFYKVISFGEKVDFGTVEKGVTWIVSSSDSVAGTTFLNDLAINDFVFKKSGTYTITFNDSQSHLSNECNHSSILKSMIIKVSPINMKFDLTQVKLSEPISVGNDCGGIIVSVPVIVSLENMKSSTITMPDFQIAGVGCEITAKPTKKEMVVKQGTQIVTYQLSGSAKTQAYLMFDFTNSNSQVQTYNYNQLIK